MSQPSQAQAQVCMPSVRVDTYKCVWENNNCRLRPSSATLDPEVSVLASCNTNLSANPECLTTWPSTNNVRGICSSNDTCNTQATTEAQCITSCSNSPAKCWQNTTPGGDPTNPGGGTGGGGGGSGGGGGGPATGTCNAYCYDNSECPASGYVCYGSGPGVAGRCRANACRTDATCSCAPTPTIPPSTQGCSVVLPNRKITLPANASMEVTVSASRNQGQGGTFWPGADLIRRPGIPSGQPRIYTVPSWTHNFTTASSAISGKAMVQAGNQVGFSRFRATATMEAGAIECTPRAVDVEVTPGTVTVTPNPLNLSLGLTGEVTAVMDFTTSDDVQIRRVVFTSGDAAIAEVVTEPDTSDPYTATILAKAVGTTVIRARVEFTNNQVINGEAVVNVTLGACLPVTNLGSDKTCHGATAADLGQVTWTFDKAANATQYRVLVYLEDGTEIPLLGTGRTVDGQSGESQGYRNQTNSTYFNCSATSCSYTTPRVAKQYGAIYAVITSRSATTPLSCSGESIDVTTRIENLDNCQTQIRAGNVYEYLGGGLPSLTSDNLCVAPTGNVEIADVGGQLVMTSIPSNTIDHREDVTAGGYDGFVIDHGTKSFSLQLDADALEEYTCICPNPSCTYGAQLVNTDQFGPINFYVTRTRESWLQVVGGDVHATNLREQTGVSFQNPVPFTCQLLMDAGTQPSCLAYSLVRKSDVPSTAGLLSAGSGRIQSFVGSVGRGSGILQNLTQDDLEVGGVLQPKTVTSIIKRKESYGYFKRLYELGLRPVSDFNPEWIEAEPVVLDPARLSTAPVGDKPAYFHDADMTINDPVTISAGQKVSIFVQGDLYVNAPTSVEVGGFLGIFVAGDIYYAADLSQAEPVEGVYLADGQVTIESQGAGVVDEQFVFNGTLVGWNGVINQRSYRNEQNNTAPVVLTTYRPDLLLNAPREILRARFLWMMVAP